MTAQFDLYKESFDAYFQDGSKKLESTKNDKYPDGKTAEKTIGYSAAAKLQETRKDLPESVQKDVKLNQECVVVYCIQKCGTVDLGDQGMLLPGVSQFLTVHTGSLWVRSGVN